MSNMKSAFAMVVLAALLARPVPAGERAYYECTLHEVLTGGKDVVLMLGVEDGQVLQHGLTVAGEPYAVCRMQEHRLKVEGGRLSGPMQI